MAITDTQTTTRMRTQAAPRDPEHAERPPRADVIELAGSQVEPGGPPVRVDPTMVNESTAARMRPSPDARHC